VIGKRADLDTFVPSRLLQRTGCDIDFINSGTYSVKGHLLPFLDLSQSFERSRAPERVGAFPHAKRRQFALSFWIEPRVRSLVADI